MCLAAPVRILEVDEKGMAQVEKDGIKLSVSTAFFPELKKGDYVLIHAGFIIQSINDEEAEERIEMIDDLYEGEP